MFNFFLVSISIVFETTVMRSQGILSRELFSYEAVEDGHGDSILLCEVLHLIIMLIIIIIEGNNRC